MSSEVLVLWASYENYLPRYIAALACSSYSPLLRTTPATPIKGIASAGIDAILFVATRFVLSASLLPNFLVAALCFFIFVSRDVILACIMPDTVRTPTAVATSPESAALKAVFVRVSSFEGCYFYSNHRSVIDGKITRADRSYTCLH